MAHMLEAPGKLNPKAIRPGPEQLQHSGLVCQSKIKTMGPYPKAQNSPEALHDMVVGPKTLQHESRALGLKTLSPSLWVPTCRLILYIYIYTHTLFWGYPPLCLRFYNHKAPQKKWYGMSLHYVPSQNKGPYCKLQEAGASHEFLETNVPEVCRSAVSGDSETEEHMIWFPRH